MFSPSIKIGGRPRELLEGDIVVFGRNIREEQEEQLRQ
jgi:hypothetical protein